VISIADDHYTTMAAAETALRANKPGVDHHQQQGNDRQSRDSDLDGRIVSTDEKEEEEEEQVSAPPEQLVNLR